MIKFNKFILTLICIDVLLLSVSGFYFYKKFLNSSEHDNISAYTESVTDSTNDVSENNDSEIIETSDSTSDIQIGSYEQSNEKVIYLTFDDGPSELTPKILEILDKYDAKATFFVVGQKPDCFKYIKEAYNKGHTIGLHTYSHDPKICYTSLDNFYKDLDDIGKVVEEQIGFVPHYIRFPGGTNNNFSRSASIGIMEKLSKDVIEKGYQYYDWNAAVDDALPGKPPTADSCYKAAMRTIGETDLIMLCHDAFNKQATVDALPKIIEDYQKEGYVFKAIDDESFVYHTTPQN